MGIFTWVLLISWHRSSIQAHHCAIDRPKSGSLQAYRDSVETPQYNLPVCPVSKPAGVFYLADDDFLFFIFYFFILVGKLYAL